MLIYLLYVFEIRIDIFCRPFCYSFM